MTFPRKSALPHVAPLSIARMLWKRKWLIAACASLLAGTAIYIIHRLPNLYQAGAVVLVDSQKIPEKFVASTVQVSLQDSLNAIGQQVLSSGQLLKIIEELDLYRDERKTKAPEEILARMRQDLPITVERGFSANQSGAFRITYQGPNPVVVAAVANRVADLFIQENFRTRRERAEGTSEFIDEQLKQAKTSLDTQEASLSQYKVRWAGELPEQQPALLGALNRLQAELQANEEALNRAQQTKQITENTLRFAESSLATLKRQVEQARTPASVPVKPAAPEVVAPPPLPSEVLRAQLDELRLRYSDDHPEVRRVQAELKEMLAAQARAAVTGPPRLEKPKPAELPVQPGAAVDTNAIAALMADLTREDERVATTRTQLDLIAKEIDSRNADRARILGEIGDYEKRVEVLPVREQQMAALTRDYETSKVNYGSLLDKMMSAEMANDMERQQQSERFTIADPAQIPTVPVRPNRRTLYGVSVLGALAVALLLGLGLELKANSFLGEWELPPDIAVLGRISRMHPVQMASVTSGLRSSALGAALGLFVLGALAALTAYIRNGA